MTYRLILTAALLFAGNAAVAFTTESVVGELSSQGYTRIEVRNGLTQTKVEAIRGTEKLEVVYDRATGAVLKTETEAVDADDNTTPGVSVRNRNRDFLRVSSSDDDNDDDGHRRGRGSDDDGSDDSSDDDGDRHGGRGGDDGGDDDNDNDGRGGRGGDDGGSDDSGSDDRGGNSGRGGDDD